MLVILLLSMCSGIPTIDIQKSVGVLLMSFPLLRLSHCLSSKNDNAKPTPI